MPAYLVRTIDKHDLVGVFYAPNVYSLAFMIDEVLDPDDCEYLLIGPGGVVWSSPAVEIPVPPNDDDEDPTKDEPVPWAGARFTESWWMLVYCESRKRWRKVDFSLEDLYGVDPEVSDFDPEPPPPRPSGGEIVPFRRRRSS